MDAGPSPSPRLEQHADSTYNTFAPNAPYTSAAYWHPPRLMCLM